MCVFLCSLSLSPSRSFFPFRYYHTTHNLPQIQPESADPEVDGVSERPLELGQLQWVIDKMYAEPYRQYEIFPLDGTDSPTQALVNEYVETQNISSHFEDFEAFGPVIATVSLCNPIYMTLKKPREKTNSCQDIIQETKVGERERERGCRLGEGCRFKSGRGECRLKSGTPVSNKKWNAGVELKVGFDPGEHQPFSSLLITSVSCC